MTDSSAPFSIDDTYMAAIEALFGTIDMALLTKLAAKTFGLKKE